MNTWWAASLALVAPLALPLFAAARGDSRERFVALQLISSVATLVLIALSFALGQSSFIELPLALGLLSLCGTLLMAVFLERWL
jgi:multisubunit Na+/H+ antiporter MnhF subunit